MSGPKLSAVVITYNRRDVVETSLRSARFADQLIVVDKGSTDGTAEIGAKYADRFVSAAWSPTVEETRAAAIDLADGEWILSLDDDECLNGAAIEAVRDALRSPAASIYYLPFRHHVLGRHEPSAYYWPEYRPALFRKGAIAFTSVVHGGVQPLTEDKVTIGAETGAAIMHLSHRDAATWVEKTNRYTSRPERAGAATMEDVTPDGVMKLVRNYMEAVPAADPDGYLAAVAALRAVYDVVDAVKRWEEAQTQAGEARFAAICEDLRRQHDALGIPSH